MKTNVKLLSVLCSLFLLAGITFAETEPQVATLRVDEANSWASLGRLYVIIATADNDEMFGKVAENNGNAISRLFCDNAAQKAVTVLKIPAENISRQTVLTLIANLPLREDDAVVFYYSGKGDLDRRYGQYFELSASKEELYRSEVLSAILAKRVRLCVLLTDFCDPTVATKPPVGETAVPFEDPIAESAEVGGDNPVEKENSPEGVAETAPLFFSLFFYNRGVVDINSASFGQASCAGGKEIGCFTEVFAGLLEVNRNKMLSWRWIFPYVQEGTSLEFVNNFPHGVVIGDATMQERQTPMLLQLGNDNIDSPTRSRVYPPGADTAPNIAVNEDEERRASDQQIVIQLVQCAVGELRPFNAMDRGTHENLKALDVDNTVLGTSGKPFSRELAAVALPVPVMDVTNEDNEDSGQTPPPPATLPTTPVRLGIQAADNQGDGVIITRVVQGMPGQRAGLEVGDVILEINGKKISSEKEYSDAIDAAVGSVTVTTRDKLRRTTTVTIRSLQNY